MFSLLLEEKKLFGVKKVKTYILVPNFRNLEIAREFVKNFRIRRKTFISNLEENNC